MYKLCFYVPENCLETVKKAVFQAGAGRIGNYDCCCWQSKGQGQFRALEGSTPFIGEQGELEAVIEYKVEMVCDGDKIKDVVRSLKLAHPYEEPAFDVWKLEDM